MEPFLQSILRLVSALRGKRINKFPDAIQWSLFFGIGAIIAYSASSESWGIFWQIVGRLAISALASFVSGWFLGFLFGIPRTSQPTAQLSTANAKSPESPESDDLASDSSFSVNTNLEDISDWLTKIIVGVTLTQIRPIIENVDKLVTFLVEKSSTEGLKSFIFAVLVYFFVVGLVFGYLWARFKFASISQLIEKQTRQLLAVSDEVQQVNQEIKKQSLREEMGAQLQRLVNRQLTLKESPVTPNELQQTLEKVSSAMRTSIASRTIETRKQAWKTGNLSLIERTIPIFEALINASGPDEKFDQTYAELGFALKDKEPHEFDQAKELINKAIEERGKPWTNEMGQYKAFYELNLAQCMIELVDTDKDAIAENLQVAYEAQLLTNKTLEEPANQSVERWLQANKDWLQDNEKKYSLGKLISDDSGKVPSQEDTVTETTEFAATPPIEQEENQ
ncbi:MAG: hypothetical protein AB4063_17495 [Crocosphaera sp.]